jgi:hypothetical protein
VILDSANLARSGGAGTSTEITRVALLWHSVAAEMVRNSTAMIAPTTQGASL